MDSSKEINVSVIAIKSGILGAVFASCVTLILLSTLFGINAKLIKVCGNLMFVSTFHYLEFLITAIYNPSALDDDSFILEDKELHIAQLASMIEYLVIGYKMPTMSIGIFIIIIAQTSRSLAMVTAGHSFHHYIQKTQSEKHELITNGIYRILRHPSYLGFFWWFIGLQLYFGNFIVLIAGGYKLIKFFQERIEYEEELLIKFFGERYRNYQLEVPILIPFIN